MRDYGKIHIGFWSSDSLAGLDSDARLLAVYLLASSHTTMAGVFRLPASYACEDLGWDSERFQKGLETLSEPFVDFIEYDHKSKWVWVKKFLHFNRPDNPNQWKAVRKIVSSIPDSVSFKAVLSETVLEPLGNTPVPVPVPVLEADEISEFAVPLQGGEVHVLPLAEVAEFEQAYPKIDVAAELRKARAWCVANPTQRKTRRGIGKFINGWLSRANEKSPGVARSSAAASQAGGGRREL